MRFEDFKRRPLAALDLICRFLGLAVEPDEPIRAAAMSSFDNVLRVDHGLVSRGVFDRPINRAGAVEEYRTTFSAAMHGVFSHADLATWWTLGYGAFDT